MANPPPPPWPSCFWPPCPQATDLLNYPAQNPPRRPAHQVAPGYAGYAKAAQSLAQQAFAGPQESQMSRYTGPKVRLSRRLGVAIADLPKHNKAEFVPPGMHGGK